MQLVLYAICSFLRNSVCVWEVLCLHLGEASRERGCLPAVWTPSVGSERREKAVRSAAAPWRRISAQQRVLQSRRRSVLTQPRPAEWSRRLSRAACPSGRLAWPSLHFKSGQSHKAGSGRKLRRTTLRPQPRSSLHPDRRRDIAAASRQADGTGGMRSKGAAVRGAYQAACSRGHAANAHSQTQ